jgi:hypothetical protein
MASGRWSIDSDFRGSGFKKANVYGVGIGFVSQKHELSRWVGGANSGGGLKVRSGRLGSMRQRGRGGKLRHDMTMPEGGADCSHTNG